MKKKAFAIYLLVTLIFFGMLVKLEYATDTYAVFNFNQEQIYMHYAMLGRFITAIVGKILKIINISEYGMYFISWILAIFCALISQYKLYTIIEINVKNKVLKLIIPILIIINPFSIELFLYIEKGIMWFGVLMCILALEKIIKVFEIYKEEKENKNKDKDKNKTKYKLIILSMIYIFLANCSYQGIVGIFVAISLVYILKYSKTIKDFIIHNILVALIYGIPTITNYAIIKIIYSTSRVSGEIKIFESLEKIYINTFNMCKNMYNLLPQYLFIFLILFTFGVFCYKIFKKKEKVLQLLKFIYILVGITIVAVLPQIGQSTNSIWFVPRVTYCFASAFGILILYLSMNYELNLKEISTKLIIFLSLILMIFQLQKFLSIEKTRYILNEKDKQITMQIIEKIEEYEKNTGNTITEISLYQDKEQIYSYPGIVVIGDINVKCFANGWSAVAILDYYLNRDTKLVKNEEKIMQKYSKENWNEFKKEQINFEKNRIILCNY